MLKRTEGIVLKNYAFGEADLIVTYLSRDYGLIKLFAKSPRKIKSRFGSSLEPLTYSNISFIGKEDANLPRLTQSDIIMPFYKLREDFNCFNKISEILQLSLNLLPERDANIEVFNLLLDTFLKLQANGDNDLYYLYFKTKLLEITGYSPRLDICGRCGNELQGSKEIGLKGKYKTSTALCVSELPGQYNFYVSHGSIICKRCISDGNGSTRLSAGALRFYRSFLRWNPSNIDRIKASENLLIEISDLINSHIRYIINE